MPVVVVVEVAAVPPGSYSQEIITPNDKTKMVTLKVGVGKCQLEGCPNLNL